MGPASARRTSLGRVVGLLTQIAAGLAMRRQHPAPPEGTVHLREPRAH
jgi:hypothetical protein